LFCNFLNACRAHDVVAFYLFHCFRKCVRIIYPYGRRQILRSQKIASRRAYMGISITSNFLPRGIIVLHAQTTLSITGITGSECSSMPFHTMHGPT
jgi:hypothetical protein